MNQRPRLSRTMWPVEERVELAHSGRGYPDRPLRNTTTESRSPVPWLFPTLPPITSRIPCLPIISNYLILCHPSPITNRLSYTKCPYLRLPLNILPISPSMAITIRRTFSRMTDLEESQTYLPINGTRVLDRIHTFNNHIHQFNKKFRD